LCFNNLQHATWVRQLLSAFQSSDATSAAVYTISWSFASCPGCHVKIVNILAEDTAKDSLEEGLTLEQVEQYM